MKFSTRVLIGLGAGLVTGVFLGDLVAPLKLVADGFVRLLQMTVLPYVTASIIANLGALTYAEARTVGLRTLGVMGIVWVAAIAAAFLMPLTFPPIESASFFSPASAPVEAFSFLDLYIPTNPFHSLANGIVPAVVLFSIILGLALIGVEKKQPLLDVLHSASEALGAMARFIVRLSPYGIFAIAAHAAGTLEVTQIQRLEVFLVAYVAISLLLALWVLPGLIAALTPIGVGETLSASRDALLTAFLVGDLFIVLPALMDACSTLVGRHLTASETARDLPASIIPTSFTFPHAGKLLSVSFVLFAGWFSDAAVPLLSYPKLALGGFFAFFGSMNVAVPFLLDMLRIPADTFQLFLATGVINSRFGTLLAAVHTLTIGVLGSAAIAGALRVQPARLVRYVLTTAVLSVAVVVSLRIGFSTLIDLRTDGRAVLESMEPLDSPIVLAAAELTPAQVPEAEIPPADRVLESIRARGRLRVGVIGDTLPYAFRNGHGELVGLDVEMAEHLARELGVTPEFVRLGLTDLTAQVQARTVDIVMSGARLTPLRAAAFAFSEPYLDETLAIVVRDHARGDFASWAGIRDLGPLRLGTQNVPYYLGVIRELVPNATVSVLDEMSEPLDVNAPFDAYVLPAERAALLTMLSPQFSVVVPEGRTLKVPLAYPLAGDDASWVRYVNAWVALKKRDGFIDRLYEHWIRGRAATKEAPRWSIVRDVLHWRR
jgi:Na+/H+-dicarboxylate symporter/ABC-type amino acid transport substrate-binding protein